MPCASHDSDHAALLRAARMRVTAARIAILDVLCHAERPIDAQEVADRLKAAEKGRSRSADRPRTDRVTVYRTLGSLERAGIAHRVHAGDRVWRYALAGASAPVAHADASGGPGDSRAAQPAHAHTHSHAHAPDRPRRAHAPHELDAADHPHFVCDSCGRVECLDELSVILKPSRPGAPAAARVRRDRRITRQDVLLHGTCVRCQTER